MNYKKRLSLAKLSQGMKQTGCFMPLGGLGKTGNIKYIPCHCSDEMDARKEVGEIPTGMASLPVSAGTRDQAHAEWG